MAPEALKINGRPKRLTIYSAPLGLIKRASDDEIRNQATHFDDPLIKTLLNSVGNIVLVLNKYRQIVFANTQLLNLLELDSSGPILGLRPGELLRCEHGVAAEKGCGTAEACTQCGALKVILSGLEDIRSVEECRITRRGMNDVEAFDLRVCGSPFKHAGDRYVVFSILDISHEKRRRALERIFFHDILNTVGSLRNLMELMCEDAPEGFQEEALLVHQFFQGMVEEIQAQKLLLEAESNELQPKMQPLHTKELLLSVVSAMRNHEVAKGRSLEIDPDTAGCFVQSDMTLLRRVLTNMVKNALEAEAVGATISLGADAVGDDTIVFWVHNQRSIPHGEALQIFQRSFSTKGPGRGLGTYSIKLLTERYLGGKASFSSTPEEGTVFRVALPLMGCCP